MPRTLLAPFGRVACLACEYLLGALFLAVHPGIDRFEQRENLALARIRARLRRDIGCLGEPIETAQCLGPGEVHGIG